MCIVMYEALTNRIYQSNAFETTHSEAIVTGFFDGLYFIFRQKARQLKRKIMTNSAYIIMQRTIMKNPQPHTHTQS